MLVKEIVYACLELAKAATSDDSYLNEELTLFLLKKYRSFLIKKEQEKENNSTDIASEFEYQEICLTLEQVAAIDGSPCTGGYYLRTVEEIPKILEGTVPRVYPVDYYQSGNITYVSRDRMRYAGSNPMFNNMIYTSLGPDKHLYLKSGNQQFLYLNQLRVSAIFEDFEEAAEYSCDDSSSSATCDVLDETFPIREYLVPMLIDLVVKELTGATYKPKDSKNNANDDLGDLRSTSDE